MKAVWRRLTRRKQRGALFITALIALAVFFMIGVTFLSQAMDRFMTARRDVAALHALAMADGGVNYAIWCQNYGPANLKAPTSLPAEYTNPRQLISDSGNTGVQWHRISPIDADDEFYVWICSFQRPDPQDSSKTLSGYMVISKGAYRTSLQGIRAVFQGNTNATGPQAGSQEDAIFSGAFYSDHGFTLGGACQINGSAIVNCQSGEQLKLSAGSSVTGSLAVNGPLTASGGTAVTVTQDLLVNGNTNLSAGANIGGGLKCNGDLTMTGGANLTGTVVVNGNANLGASGTFNNGLKVAKNLTIPSWNPLTIKNGTEVGGSATFDGSGTLQGGLKVAGNLTVNDWRTPSIAGDTQVNGSSTIGGGTLSGGVFRSGGTVAIKSGGTLAAGTIVECDGTKFTNTTGKPITPRPITNGTLPVAINVPTINIPQPSMPILDIDSMVNVANLNTQLAGPISLGWGKKLELTDSYYKLANGNTVSGSGLTYYINGDLTVDGALLKTTNTTIYVNGNVTLSSSGGTNWQANNTVIYAKKGVSVSGGNTKQGAGTIAGSGKVVIISDQNSITFNGNDDAVSGSFVLLSKTGVELQSDFHLNAHVYAHNSLSSGFLRCSSGGITGSAVIDRYDPTGSAKLNCTYAPVPFPFIPTTTGGGGGTTDTGTWALASWEML